MATLQTYKLETIQAVFNAKSSNSELYYIFKMHYILKSYQFLRMESRDEDGETKNTLNFKETGLKT
jgi:hypothetical protein